MLIRQGLLRVYKARSSDNHLDELPKLIIDEFHPPNSLFAPLNMSLVIHHQNPNHLIGEVTKENKSVDSDVELLEGEVSSPAFFQLSDLDMSQRQS